MDGASRLPAEQAHHVVFAQVKPLRQALDADILRQMPVQVADDARHPLVARGLWAGPGDVSPAQAPSDAHQQSQHRPGAEDRLAVVLLPQLPLQSRRLGEEPLPLRLPGPQHMGHPEALRQIAVRPAGPLQKLRGDVEDDPLIGRSRLEFRPMDRVAAHQDDVAALDGIAAAVHHVAAGPGHQQQNLVKFVIMKFRPGPLPADQMEQPEILGQEAFFLIVTHSIPLSRRERRPRRSDRR